MSDTHAVPDALSPHVASKTRGDFVAILDRLGISIILSTRPNLIVCLGALDGDLTLSATMLSQPMGLAVDAGRIAVATARTVMIFANVSRLAPHYPGKPNHYDAYFVPRTIHMTGDCHMHDMVFQGQALIGVNTNFSCVCRIDGVSSFTPLWQPPFITQLRAEDRCHLNGFAVEGSQLRYVTALAGTDGAHGWRERPIDQGILIDAERGATLRSDLCMPHSPRLVGDTLYVLNGGEGEVLTCNRETGSSEIVARLPGFTHGLSSHGGYLFVGMSQNRASRAANPPPLAQRREALIAGVAIIEERTGAIMGALEFDAGVTEVYDVQIIPGVRRAGLQNLLSNDRYIAVDTPNAVFWTRRSAEDVHHSHDVVATGHYRLSLDIEHAHVTKDA